MKSNRKFRKMVEKMSDKAKLDAAVKALKFIQQNPNRYTKEEEERVRQLVQEMKSKFVYSDSDPTT